jgi:hypothetical protein
MRSLIRGTSPTLGLADIPVVDIQPLGQIGEGAELLGAGGPDVGAELVQFRLGHGRSIAGESLALNGNNISDSAARW